MHYFDRLTNSDIKGAKSYFTGFDNRLLSRMSKSQIEKHLLYVERKLKLQLLTNNNILFGATQMTNTHTYNFFKKHPILLNQGLLIPTLRSDKNGFEDLFFEKRIKKELKNERVEFYNNNTKLVADWDLFDNSNWFKENFLYELKTQNSVLRRNLFNIEQTKIDQLCSEIENSKVLSRKVINQNIIQFKPSEKKAILNFRELLYHISGARIMECESLVPQEELIDYSLTDLKNRETILNEYQIFNKIFLSLASETLKLKIVKIDLFDYLDFSDILIIRQIIDNNKFRENYQSFLKLVVQGFEKNEPKEILMHHEEIMRLHQTLKNEFKDRIDIEIQYFLKKMKNKKVLKSGIEFGKGAVSIALGVASIAEPLYTFIGIAKDSPSTIINVTQMTTTKTELDKKLNYVQQKKKLMTSIIDKGDFKNETMLLDMISLLSNYISVDLSIQN